MHTIVDFIIQATVEVEPGATVTDAVKLMRENRVGAVLVQDRGKVIGIFTERDLLNKFDFQDPGKLLQAKIKDVMTKDLKTVNHDQTYIEAVDLMRQQKIRHTPVVKDGKVVGMVSLRDLATHYEEHLKIRLDENSAKLLESLNKMKESEEKLKKAIAIKSEFTHTVSHELRTPLTSIKGSIDLVLRGTAGALNEDQRTFLGKAQKNIDRLKRLIDDVLDVAKLESGELELKIKENDLNALIAEVVDSQQIPIKQKEIFLKADLDKGVPPIPFDWDSLTQVLYNLINNAVKYTRHGGIMVISKYYPKQNNVEVIVKDTGFGIPKEDISKLFQKFHQLGDPELRPAGGTGLGLAICKGLIQKHGGKIWVESQLGRGSEFHFLLPIVQRREQS